MTCYAFQQKMVDLTYGVTVVCLTSDITSDSVESYAYMTRCPEFWGLSSFCPIPANWNKFYLVSHPNLPAKFQFIFISHTLLHFTPIFEMGEEKNWKFFSSPISKIGVVILWGGALFDKL